jgi:hypothetical protein
LPEGLLDQRFSVGASRRVVGLARFNVLLKISGASATAKAVNPKPVETGFEIALYPGRKTPGLVTLRESRVNAAKGNGDASTLCYLLVQLDASTFQTASVPNSADGVTWLNLQSRLVRNSLLIFAKNTPERRFLCQR